ncbi:MAG: DEAD/DEAH box helicase [Alphaproteobacteria bacterium]
MITITIDNRLRIPIDTIPTRVLADLEKAFKHKNPSHGKAKAMGHLYTKEPTHIVTSAREVDADGDWHLTLPRGGIGRLCDALDAAGLIYDFVDNRTHGRDLGAYTGDFVTPQVFPDWQGDVLWEHQERIVQGILKSQNCIVKSGTGSGKTSALLAAIQRAQVPAIVVMNDTKLLKQWKRRVESEMGIPVKQQGLIHGKVKRLRPITLAMQQTLWNVGDEEWDQIARAFGFFGLDEVQFAAAKTVMSVADRFHAHYRVGVSADHTRHDKKDFLTSDLFGEVAVDVPDSELISAGIVFDVAIRIIPTEYEDEEYLRERERGGRPDFNQLLDRMGADVDRNDLIRRTVEGCMAELQPTLVVAHRVAHCRKLDALFTADGHATGLMLGMKDNEGEFESTLAGLCDGSKFIGVGTYKAIGTGQDIPPIEAGIATTPIHNNRQFVDQVCGRICRRSVETGKKGARLYYLWDREIYGRTAVQKLLRWCNDVKVLDDGGWTNARAYLEKTYGNKTKAASGQGGRRAVAPGSRR